MLCIDRLGQLTTWTTSIDTIRQVSVIPRQQTINNTPLALTNKIHLLTKRNCAVSSFSSSYSFVGCQKEAILAQCSGWDVEQDSSNKLEAFILKHDWYFPTTAKVLPIWSFDNSVLLTNLPVVTVIVPEPSSNTKEILLLFFFVDTIVPSIRNEATGLPCKVLDPVTSASMAINIGKWWFESMTVFTGTVVYRNYQSSFGRELHIRHIYVYVRSPAFYLGTIRASYLLWSVGASVWVF